MEKALIPSGEDQESTTIDRPTARPQHSGGGGVGSGGGRGWCAWMGMGWQRRRQVVVVVVLVLVVLVLVLVLGAGAGCWCCWCWVLVLGAGAGWKRVLCECLKSGSPEVFFPPVVLHLWIRVVQTAHSRTSICQLMILAISLCSIRHSGSPCLRRYHEALGKSTNVSQLRFVELGAQIQIGWGQRCKHFYECR